MKEFDQYDNKIESILTANIYEPDSYTNVILNALNKKREKKTISLPKLVAAIIAGAMIIGGVVYAKQIGEFITRFFNNSKGTDTAVENGYVINIYDEFNTESETKVKINNLLMDNRNLNFILSFDFYRDIDLIESVSITDLLITDELNNILYCKNKEKFEDFCNMNNLDYEFLKYNDNYMNTGMFLNYKRETNELVYNIKSLNNFPNSKRIIIEFNNILVEMIDGNLKEISGKWKIDIETSNKLDNRNAVIYEPIDINGANITKLKFNVLNTETLFELEALLKPFITEEMTDQEKKTKIIEFENWCKESQNKQIKNIYIETSDGKIFNELNNNFEDEGIEYFYNGNLNYMTSFDLTKYDLTDYLTLHFTIHAINEDKDVTIKLQKVDN